MMRVKVTGLRQVEAALFGATEAIEKKAERAVAAVVAALEGWAKVEHKYTDRTGNLTNSIRGELGEVTAAIVRGYLSAGMEYSIYLELARSGKWAFLWPVVEKHREDIRKIIVAELGVSVGVTLHKGPIKT